MELEEFSQEDLRRVMSLSNKDSSSKLKEHHLYQLIEDFSTDLLDYDRFYR